MDPQSSTCLKFPWRGSVGLEALFLPLCLWSRTRPLAWAGIVGMHLGILLVVNFADLTTGMLMVHLFTFDPRWIKARAPGAILFFDGVCGLCNSTVQFLLDEDRAGSYRFSPLQGQAARERLGVSDDPMQEFKTLVLVDGDKVYRRSEAVLRTVAGLGGIWSAAWALLLVPASVRDLAYDFVSRRRYAWFGKLDSCRLPTPAERARFLT